jgi:hypothetical protein
MQQQIPRFARDDILGRRLAASVAAERDRHLAELIRRVEAYDVVAARVERRVGIVLHAQPKEAFHAIVEFETTTRCTPLADAEPVMIPRELCVVVLRSTISSFTSLAPNAAVPIPKP